MEIPEREENGGRGDRRVNVERGRGGDRRVFMRIGRVKVERGKERRMVRCEWW